MCNPSPKDLKMENKSEPKIYVACLAAYNNGILHGRWIDANQDADTIRDEIAAGRPAKAHRALDELDIVLNWLPGVARDGGVLVRAGQKERHKAVMMAAVVTSALFLAAYLLYHFTAPIFVFPGPASIKPFYYAILISHVVLATVILPFIVKDDYPIPPRQIETGDHAERLRRFKDRVAREQVVHSFGSPDELAKEVAIAITRIWTTPMGEAVKDIVASPELRKQLAALKSERVHHLEVIDDLRARLSQVVPARPIWRARNFEPDSTLCFCLLPFQDEFIRVFEEGMLPAAQAAGLRAVHAGQIFDNREIVEDIWELL